ncbi:putative RNA-directed DNA polymerase from transposon BS [Trichonephila clavipes]|nr:putative RNA-directed DNA polymerase from transposon BS [Trichonephila clavipes]
MRDFIDKHAPDLLLIQNTSETGAFFFPPTTSVTGTTGPTQSVAGGGTAIIKEIFPIFHVPTLPLLTGVEATLVALTPPTDPRTFLVASIYAPPDPNYRNLNADLDALFKIFNTVIVTGDYNAKHTFWGCVSSDPRVLTLRYFPKSWKTAVVVPILKPGKNSALAESYRPISLLPVLSKLAEKVILARFNDYLERENILIPEQHGFRPRLSTPIQLLRVMLNLLRKEITR